MAVTKTVLKKTHQEEVVKVAGTAAAATTCACFLCHLLFISGSITPRHARSAVAQMASFSFLLLPCTRHGSRLRRRGPVVRRTSC